MKRITLTAMGIAFSVLLLNACRDSVQPPITSSGGLADLEEKFDELTEGESPMKSLTVVLRTSNHFIQFVHREDAVYIDFPLYTDGQKELEAGFRKACEDLGLTIRETTDPEGNRNFDASAGSDSAELARISRKLLEDLFSVDKESELEFTLMPLRS